MTTIPKDIIAAAQASQTKWSVPASISIAQWAIESGYGAHMPPASNNPFGIKARPGQPSVEAMTAEYIGGRTIHLMQPFRNSHRSRKLSICTASCCMTEDHTSMQ